MSKISKFPDLKKIVKNWLSTDLLQVLSDTEALAEVVVNFPVGIGSSSASRLKSINSMDIDGLKMLSLSESTVEVSISVNINMSVDVGWDDYLSSPEVREFVGEVEEEFISNYSSFDSDVDLKIYLIILNFPPMVASHEIVSISGDYKTITFKN